jgi:hypothetical protein
VCCKWHHRPTTVTPPPAPKHTGRAQGPLKTATRCRLNKAQGRTGSSGSSHPLGVPRATFSRGGKCRSAGQGGHAAGQTANSLQANVFQSSPDSRRKREWRNSAPQSQPWSVRRDVLPIPLARRACAAVQSRAPFFCVRLRAGECGTRHSGAAGLAWPPQYSAYSSLYRARPGQVPRFLALVTPPSPARRRRTTFVGRPRAGESTQCTILR